MLEVKFAELGEASHQKFTESSGFFGMCKTLVVVIIYLLSPIFINVLDLFY